MQQHSKAVNLPKTHLLDFTLALFWLQVMFDMYVFCGSVSH